MTLMLSDFRFNQIFSIYSLISYLDTFFRSNIVSVISLSREKIAQNKKLYVKDLIMILRPTIAYFNIRDMTA